MNLSPKLAHLKRGKTYNMKSMEENYRTLPWPRIKFSLCLTTYVSWIRTIFSDNTKVKIFVCFYFYIANFLSPFCLSLCSTCFPICSSNRRKGETDGMPFTFWLKRYSIHVSQQVFFRSITCSWAQPYYIWAQYKSTHTRRK